MANALGATCLYIIVAVVIKAESSAAEISNTYDMLVEEFLASNHVPYTTISISSRKREISNMIARSPKKRRQNSATETLAAVVKVNDVRCYGTRGVVASFSKGGHRQGSTIARNEDGMMCL